MSHVKYIIDMYMQFLPPSSFENCHFTLDSATLFVFYYADEIISCMLSHGIVNTLMQFSFQKYDFHIELGTYDLKILVPRALS